MDKRVFVLINDRVQSNAALFLTGLPVDGTCEVEFRPVKKTKTSKQNAALWACAYPPLMEAMGLRGEKDRLELHEYFCGEFWGWKAYEMMGTPKQRPFRTTTTDEHGKKNYISKSEMADFFSFIQQRAAEHGVIVDDPDPMYGINKR